MVVTLGHSAWGEGQLEQELSLNAWLTVPADPTIVFDVPHSEKLGAAMNLLGIDPLMLSDQVGHA
jgi:putative transcriptional regulator